MTTFPAARPPFPPVHLLGVFLYVSAAMSIGLCAFRSNCLLPTGTSLQFTAQLLAFSRDVESPQMTFFPHHRIQTLHICVLDTHPLESLVQLPAGSLFGLTKVEAYPGRWVLQQIFVVSCPVPLAI